MRPEIDRGPRAGSKTGTGTVVGTRYEYRDKKRNMFKAWNWDRDQSRELGQGPELGGWLAGWKTWRSTRRGRYSEAEQGRRLRGWTGGWETCRQT